MTSFGIPADRLKVFVSSTIEECASERQIARAAITSVGHDPVLFERIGARPYPPRDVYKPRLERSHMVVCIYRESYGWVGPDIGISGIEDELTIARSRGLKRLIYVLRHAPNRDPRLQKMLDTMFFGDYPPTVFFYDSPEELHERIRADISAVLAESFLAVQPMDVQPAAADLLRSIVPASSQLYRRTEVEAEIIARINKQNALIVTGAIGCGKTVLLAQLSVEHGWVFVNARQRSSIDVLRACTNHLRRRSGLADVGLAVEMQTGKELLLQALSEVNDVTLVVDAAEDPNMIYDAASPVLGGGRRLIIAPRRSHSLAHALEFSIPKLSDTEIGGFVAALRGSDITASEREELARYSAGNALYLRFYALGQAGEAARSLRDLEIAEWRALPPRSRELVSFLALAERPLALADLLELLGNDESSESVAAAADDAAVLLQQNPQGVSLVHEHLRATLLEELRASPLRLRFYAGRLASHLLGNGDYLQAFLVLDTADDDAGALALADPAGDLASKRSDYGSLVRIHRRRAEAAVRDKDSWREAESRALLGQALSQSGRINEALEQSRRAAYLANELQDPELRLRVQELRLDLHLSTTGAASLLGELEAIRDGYQQQGDSWNTARLSILLSREYIAASRYAAAADAAASARSALQEIGDSHGVHIATLNLASALSALPDRSAELKAIIAELEQQPDVDAQPRQQALLANLLARESRRRGEPERAAEFAREAIRLGRVLEDVFVVVRNTINLGNALRDQELLDDALAQYELAERAAREADLRPLQASALELIASVHNQKGIHTVALEKTAEAIRLARPTTDLDTCARAYEERAIALQSIGRPVDAIAAYTDAIAVLAQSPDYQSFWARLFGDTLFLATQHRRWDLIAAAAHRGITGETSVPPDAVRSPLPFILDLLPTIASRTPTGKVSPLVTFLLAGQMATAPVPLQREVTRRVITRIIESDEQLTMEQRLLATAGILMAVDLTCLSLHDYADIADSWLRRMEGVSNKPYPDGAAHWVLEMPGDQPALASITQIDDSPGTCGAVMILVAQLRGLWRTIEDSIFGAATRPRSEFQIQVSDYETFREHIDKTGKIQSESSDTPVLVASSTNPRTEQQSPILVVLREPCFRPWRLLETPIGPAHLVLAQTLVSVTQHVFAGEVDPDTVRPKLTKFIKHVSGLAIRH